MRRPDLTGLVTGLRPRHTVRCSVSSGLLVLNVVALFTGGVVGIASASHLTCTITGSGEIIGTSGDDVICGSSESDTIDGLEGNDIILADAGNDDLNGGAGADTVDYQHATSAVVVDLPAGTATGGAGSDTVSGIENATGSAFNDSLIGDALSNILVGADGDDTLAGSGGGDILAGGEGNDTLGGGDGDDLLAGAGGEDTLEGEAGSDTADFAGAIAAVRVDLAAGTSEGAGADVLASIENVTGSGFDDILTGNAGSNVLAGGVGNDLLAGAGGDDRVEGGTGSDTAGYAGATGPVGVDLAGGTSEGAGNDILAGIENVSGSSFDDILTGDVAPNVLAGGEGNDLLAGGGGADTLEGEGGSDTADYAGATGPVRVDLAGGTSEGVGSDFLSGIEDVTGSDFDDILTGGAGPNDLAGGEGDDLLAGAGGDDFLEGGAGSDTASFGGGPIEASLLTGTATGQGADRLFAIEALRGSAFDDFLHGDAEDNRLMGGEGNDTLAGGVGGDELWGDGGNDALVGGPGNDVLDGGDGTDFCLPAGDDLAGCEMPDFVLMDLVSRVEDAQVVIIAEVLYRGRQGSSGVASLEVGAAGFPTRALRVTVSSGATVNRGVTFSIPQDLRGEDVTFSAHLVPLEGDVDPSNDSEEIDVILGTRVTPATSKVLPIAIATAVAGAAAGLTARRAVRARIRRRWQDRAEDVERNGPCDGGSEYCLRLSDPEFRPALRRVSRLTVTTTGAGLVASGKAQKQKRSLVRSMNLALMAHRLGRGSEAVRTLIAPVGGKLASGITTRLEQESGPCDVVVTVHVKGSKASQKFGLYRCEQEDGQSRWKKTRDWTARMRNRFADPLTTLKSIDGRRADLRDHLEQAITERTYEFICNLDLHMWPESSPPG